MAGLNAVIYRIDEREKKERKEGKRREVAKREIKRSRIFWKDRVLCKWSGMNEQNKKCSRRKVKTPRKTANAKNAGVVRSSRHEFTVRTWIIQLKFIKQPRVRWLNEEKMPWTNNTRCNRCNKLRKWIFSSRSRLEFTPRSRACCVDA